MKKSVKLLSLALCLMLVFSLCACTHSGNNGPSEIDIPTPEPTAAPVALDPALIDGLLGDWYGIYSVTAAGGMYGENAGVRNDCAIRISLDPYGTGSCYLVVNGIGADAVSGSTNVFALCTASVDGRDLAVRGMVNRYSIDWRFRLDGSILKLSETYGEGSDYMNIEIVAARPDQLSESGMRFDALDYITANGYADVLEKLGGSEIEIPALFPVDGWPAHEFFTNAVPADDPYAASRITSVDGHFRISLPEGYMVLQNDGAGLVVASPDENITKVEFSVKDTELDNLSYLLAVSPEASELYHYMINGFDFYGAFVTAPVPGITAAFRLCGTDESGKLIQIDLVMGLTDKSARAFINSDVSSFIELVLCARFDV